MNYRDRRLLAEWITVEGGEKRAFANTMKTIADQGSYFLPGVGTARMGYDAAKAFGQGRWMAGIGNTIGAGLSLIPGAGGIIGGLGRGAARLGSKMMPRLTAGVGSKLPTFSAGAKMLGKSVAGAEQGLANFTNVGRSALAKAMPSVAQSAPVQMMKSKPLMAHAGTGASLYAGNTMQAGKDMAAQAAQQHTANMSNWLKSLTNSGAGNFDPVWASPV